MQDRFFGVQNWFTDVFGVKILAKWVFCTEKIIIYESFSNDIKIV